MNNKLKKLRLEQGYTQSDVAELAHCTRSHYSLIETGRRKGSREFWKNIQTAFKLTDGETWGLIKNDATDTAEIHDTAC